MFGLPVIAWAIFKRSAAATTLILAATAGPGPADRPASTSPASTPDRAVTASDAVPSDARDCTSCHQHDDSLSHPIGVPLKGAAPAQLPLEDGRITCLTCHDAALAGGHSNRRPTGSSFLRESEDARTLCSACHVGGPDRASAHASGFERAHFARSSGAPSRGRNVLDEESRMCMGCHDGAAAGAAASHAAAPERDQPAEHPIGVPLDGPRHERGGPQLVRASDIDKRVRLFNGAVGCGSCHAGYSKRDNLLVMSNRASTLCLACHKM